MDRATISETLKELISVYHKDIDAGVVKYVQKEEVAEVKKGADKKEKKEKQE